jgi:hypothetical protein
MKASLFLSTVFAFQAFAFPAALLNGGLSAEDLAKITELALNISAQHEKRQLGLGIFEPGFDAKAQKIETTGTHAYVGHKNETTFYSIGTKCLTRYRNLLERMTSVAHVLG